MNDPSDLIEKVPPHSKEAEIAVLGGVLLDADALGKVVAILKPEHFYYPAHQLIFKHVEILNTRNMPVDILSLGESLRQHEQLEMAGGSSYLMALVNSIPTTANIEHYARIVERHAILRGLISAGTQIVETAYNAGDDEIATILNNIEQMIFSIGQQRMSKGLIHIQPVLWKVFEELEQSFSTPEAMLDKNLTTGFSDLNQFLGGGMSPSDLIILAARPAMGKTALALNIGTSLALEHNKPVAIFNLEMSKEQLITRILCTVTGMNSRTLRSGTLHTDQWQTISDAIARLTEAPIYIDDSSNVTPAELRAKTRRLKAEQKDLGLIIIDYIQLMETGNSENRAQEVSKISRSMKQLARELDVPVVALSQLNRGVEQRQNKRPMLSDLRESGAIEQDADIVLFLYRDEYYNPDSKDKNTAEVIIAKHRHGPTGTVKLFFDAGLTKFANLSLTD